jgi:hypothetical protein
MRAPLSGDLDGAGIDALNSTKGNTVRGGTLASWEEERLILTDGVLAETVAPIPVFVGSLETGATGKGMFDSGINVFPPKVADAVV